MTDLPLTEGPVPEGTQDPSDARFDIPSPYVTKYFKKSSHYCPCEECAAEREHDAMMRGQVTLDFEVA